MDIQFNGGQIDLKRMGSGKDVLSRLGMDRDSQEGLTFLTMSKGGEKKLSDLTVRPQGLPDKRESL